MTDEIQGPPAEMPPPSGIKVRKAAFGFVMITVLLDVMGLGLVIPVWPALITSFTGSMANAGWWVGVSGTTWAVTQFFCQPIIGALSDKVGRRPVFLASNLGTGVDWFVTAPSPARGGRRGGRRGAGAAAAAGGAACA